jgi:hypothetical protein
MSPLEQADCTPEGPELGRLLTDLLLQTRHSARRSRNRRCPANLDPELSVASVGFTALNRAKSEGIKAAAW